MLRKCMITGLTLMIWAGLTQGAAAQQVLSIAAVVNDEVISAYDLEERLDLVIVSANLPSTQETRRRLRAQVLRTLVDEELQKSAARNANVTVTGADIDREIDDIAERNNLTASVLLNQLARSGVEEYTLRQQVLAGIAWQRFMARRLLRTVEVSEEEIDEFVAESSAKQGEKSYRVSEILLPVNTLSEEDDVRQAADRLVRQIRSGARFGALARQFSAGATAAQGGDVGWVTVGQLGPEIEGVLATLSEGAISEPIRISAGFTIIGVAGVRIEGARDLANIEVELTQILIPLGREAPEEDVAKAVNAAGTLRGLVSSCADAAPLADRLTAANAADLGRLKIGDLPASFGNAIALLEIGEVSPPIRTAAGMHLLIVCDRSKPIGATLDRERVRNEILTRKLNQRAQVFLRDLRRDAIVDYR